MNTRTHSSLDHRGDTGQLGFGPQIHPAVVPPETAPLTNHVLSPLHDPPRLPCATYPGSSSSGLGTWSPFLDTINLSQQGAVYPSLPPATSRPVELPHTFDHCHSSTFLPLVAYNPVPSSSRTRVSHFPTSVHRETTPIQSGTIHLGMYQASNSTEGHLYCSTSNSHYSSISQSSQYPMPLVSTTCSPRYRHPRAQIDMTTAISGIHFPAGQWGPTSSVPSSRQYTPYRADEVNSNPGIPDVLRRHGPTQ